jgi:hypothetical protein
VFEADYLLHSIKEVAAFIKANKYLPDMLSEKELLENYVDKGQLLSMQQGKIYMCIV